MKIDIFGDGISYVTDEVSTVKTIDANLNEENRIKFVTDLAAVSRGKNESVNPKKRYEALKTEAALNSASRPLEFLPVIIDFEINENCGNNDGEIFLVDNDQNKIYETSLDHFNNVIGRFSYMRNYRCYTNMRTLINAGVPYENIPYMCENLKNEYKHFKAIKLCIPMYLWSQWPMTHTMLSKESQSDRVATQDQYWLPADFEKRLLDYIEKNSPNDLNVIGNDGNFNTIFYTTQDVYNALENPEKDFIITFKEHMINYFSQSDVQLVFKTLGYKQEIWSRAPYYFKYKEVVVTGWNNDPATWQHSFLERNVLPDQWKNWTQKETTKVLEAVKKVIDNGN